MERAFLKAEVYKPQVGDVVKFTYRGKQLRAIVYHDNSEGLSSIDSTTLINGKGVFRAFKRRHPELDDCVKVGSVDVFGVSGWTKARIFASKYFYGVDSVEGKPTNQPSTNSTKSGSFIPTGDYFARQKQWIEHYNIKEGSKVILTRVAKASDESGWPMVWINNIDKYVGCIVTVGKIQARTMAIGPDSIQGYVPYFVLQPVD